MVEPAEKVIDDNFDGENEENDDELERLKGTHYEMELINACKKGEFERAKKAIEKKPESCLKII